MKETLEAKVKKLETDIVFFEKENTSNINEINQLSPDYGKLCGHYEKTVKDYEETRRNVIGNLEKQDFSSFISILSFFEISMLLDGNFFLLVELFFSIFF